MVKKSRRDGRSSGISSALLIILRRYSYVCLGSQKIL